MGKVGLRRKVRALEQRIEEHEEKITAERARPRPDEGRLRHWEAEIGAFRDGIRRARKRLGEIR